MTVNEAADAYPDEWIFMHVREWNKHGHAHAGIVLAHYADDREISPVLRKTVEEVKQNPAAFAGGFMMYRGPMFTTNEEWLAYRRRQKAARDHNA